MALTPLEVCQAKDLLSPPRIMGLNLKSECNLIGKYMQVHIPTVTHMHIHKNDHLISAVPSQT